MDHKNNFKNRWLYQKYKTNFILRLRLWQNELKIKYLFWKWRSYGTRRLTLKASYLSCVVPPGINITGTGHLWIAPAMKFSTCSLGATWMTVINCGTVSFISSTVSEKMGSIRRTSCTLLPGSKLMTVAPFKVKIDVMIQQIMTSNFQS